MGTKGRKMGGEKMKKKAVGVIVLGVFLVVNSLLGIRGLFLPPLMNPILIGIWVILAVAMFFAGIGILLLKNTARILAIAVAGIQAMRGIVSSIIATNGMIKEPSISITFALTSGLLGFLLSLGIGAGIIYYLTQPKVKEQFNP